MSSYRSLRELAVRADVDWASDLVLDLLAGGDHGDVQEDDHLLPAHRVTDVVVHPRKKATIENRLPEDEILSPT